MANAIAIKGNTFFQTERRAVTPIGAGMKVEKKKKIHLHNRMKF